MTELEQAAINLYKARLARDKAKENLRKFREKYGGCDMARDEIYSQSPCYISRPFYEKAWCNICKKSQPFYLKRKAAGNKVASAMRRLMNLCNKSITNN